MGTTLCYHAGRIQRASRKNFKNAVLNSVCLAAPLSACTPDRDSISLQQCFRLAEEFNVTRPRVRAGMMEVLRGLDISQGGVPAPDTAAPAEPS